MQFMYSVAICEQALKSQIVREMPILALVITVVRRRLYKGRVVRNFQTALLNVIL